MKNSKVSIIVPIYNVESCLIRCLESISNQSYDNLEILLINDGSTDGSAAIAEEYMNKDNRMILFNKQNGGLSDARNYGLEKASGDYIAFVDSDDYVSSDFIETLAANLEKEQADLSIIGYRMFWDNGKEVYKAPKGLYKVYSQPEAIRHLMIQDEFESMSWAILAKKELFKDIRFPKGKLFEDIPTTFEMFLKSRKIVWQSDAKYHYYQRPDGIVNSTFNVNKADMVAFSQLYIDYARKNNCFLKEAYANYLKAILMMLLNAQPNRDNPAVKALIQRLKSELKELKQYIYNPYIQKRRQLLLYLFLSPLPDQLVYYIWKAKV